jgi:flagellar hook assembly protein FlgD
MKTLDILKLMDAVMLVVLGMNITAFGQGNWKDDSANSWSLIGSSRSNGADGFSGRKETWNIDGMITLSDAREKDNVQDMAYGLQEIMKLHPVSYTWRERPEQGLRLGLIAQEVQLVIKEVVRGNGIRHKEDAVTEVMSKEGVDAGAASMELLGINYSALIPVLIKAIQEQQTLIEQMTGIAQRNDPLPFVDIKGKDSKPLEVVVIEQKTIIETQLEELNVLKARMASMESTVRKLEKIVASRQVSEPSSEEELDSKEKLEPESAILKNESPGFSLESLPQDYDMSVNFPNPFNPATTIRYALPKDSHVVIGVYNTLGQEVTTLVDEFQTAGYKSVGWDGRDKSGRLVASGTYIYKIIAGEFVKTLKMVMTK